MRHHLKMIVLGLGMMVGGAGAISATGATSPVEHQYTLEEIKAGLAAGAAQFSHATFHYTMQFAATNVIDGVFQQTGTYDAHILYARDVATNSELYDTQVTYTPLKKGAAAIPSPLGIPTTQPDVVVLDRLWVYDGRNTTVLGTTVNDAISKTYYVVEKSGKRKVAAKEWAKLKDSGELRQRQMDGLSGVD